MEVIKFIGLLAFTWLFVKGADPVQFTKNLFDVGNDSQPKKQYLIIIQKFLNCALCSGFWIGLIYYQDILLACLVSIASELFYRLLDRVL